MKRFSILLLAALAAGVSAVQIAEAQDYPTRQITLIAPWPAGGAIDTLSRTIAPPLSERLGRSVVVENRPGAGSVIGTTAGAKAAPDGYTLAFPGSGSLAISSTMYKKLPYDPVKDFIPIALDRQDSVRARGHAVPAGALGGGAGEIRQGQSRQALVRIGRTRITPSSLR